MRTDFLVVGSRKLILSKEVSFNESDTIESKTKKEELLILFELQGLEPEYFGKFETSDIENSSTAKTHIFMHHLKQ